MSVFSRNPRPDGAQAPSPFDRDVGYDVPGRAQPDRDRLTIAEIFRILGGGKSDRELAEG